MTDDPGGVPQDPALRPRPVPVGPMGDGSGVTDDDRQRFGRLLDSALERGLLGPHEYAHRLQELAAAGSMDDLTRIVTELPVFAASGPGMPAATAPFGSTGRFGGAAGRLGRATGGGPPSRRRSNPWAMLVVTVVVVIASFVVLLVYAEHLVHSRTTGSSAAPASAPALRSSRP